MSYIILMDSCGDCSEELKASGRLASIPLRIRVDDEVFVDDGQLDRELLLQKIAACKKRLQSSCPSPGDYLAEYEKHAGQRIYVVTGTSALTGSYNSARVALQLYLDACPNAQIALFDSRPASAGEGLTAQQIFSCEQAGLDFAAVQHKVAAFIAGEKTRFVLEDLSFLQKSGRLTGIKSLIAEKLHILPLLAATPEGTICQTGQARGFARALAKLAEQVAADLKGRPAELFLSHCSCPERAEALSTLLQEKLPQLPPPKILCTGGISTLYAGRGGLVVSYSLAKTGKNVNYPGK